MDPTNDAYIMNEKGELLDIAEVRKRLINDGTLIVNPDANWNHRASTIKENYLDYYMAKNMYRFECPANSVYNLEARGKGKELVYIELFPLNHYKQHKGRREFTNPNDGTIFVRYQTNNPDRFWAPPHRQE